MNTARMVAMSNILSLPNYCSEVFASNPAIVNKIQMKINDTMRIVTRKGNRARIKTMMNELKWFSFKETVMYNRLTLLNKILDTAASPYAATLIQKDMINQQATHNTRVRELKIAWRPRLVRKGEQSFIHCSVTLYNHTIIMGKIITNDKIKDEFKNIIKSWRN